MANRAQFIDIFRVASLAETEVPAIIYNVHTVLLASLTVEVALQPCGEFLLLAEELQLFLVDLAVLLVEAVPDGLGRPVDEQVGNGYHREGQDHLVEGSDLDLFLPEGAQSFDYLVGIGPSVEDELWLKNEPVFGDRPTNGPVEGQSVIRLHLKGAIVGLSFFFYIIREDDILPPSPPDSLLLYVAIIDLNSDFLVIDIIFERKPTAGLILSELLMRLKHLVLPTRPDKPLVSVLLQLILLNLRIEDEFLLAGLFDGLVVDGILFGDDLLAPGFQEFLFLFVEETVFAELGVEEAEASDGQGSNADERALSILHNQIISNTKHIMMVYMHQCSPQCSFSCFPSLKFAAGQWASSMCVFVYTNNRPVQLQLNITSMQEQPQQWPISSLLHHLINSNHSNLMHSILSFLEPSEISVIAQASTTHPQFFYRITLAHHFLNTYINRLDRTNYFLFYDQPQFKRIQYQNILHLVGVNHHALIAHHAAFGQLVRTMQMELSSLQGQEELWGIMSSIFFQTDLVLPKMKRQTIGMYCESALQDFLALLKFPQDDIEQPWIEQCILQLKSQTQNDLQQLISHFPYYQAQQPATSSHDKIRVVRFSAFKITHENWKDYLIEGFRMHNIIVIMFAMCAQLVQSFHLVLDSQEDPFLRFTEFTLRGNVYRNLVLNLEEKFGFLFESYSRFYENVYSPPLNRPGFKLWIPALSIWIQTMKVHHPRNEKVYNYICSKMREASLLTFLQLKTEKLPSYFSTLRDQVELHLFSESRKAEAYHQNDSKVQLEYFFENNSELYEIIVKDYLQYMVDVSINQFNAHRCGHSKHIIAQHPLFRLFQKSFVDQTTLFYGFIKDLLFASAPPQLRLGFFKEVIKDDLTFCDLKLVKPVTIRDIIQHANQTIVSQVQKMHEYLIFEEEGHAKYRLSWDFQQKDTLLDYFCNKYQIGECQQKLQFYYNCQVENTNQFQDSECEDSFEYCEEYISDEEMGENDD